MKNNIRVNILIISFINWTISLVFNNMYNYVSAIVLCASLIYVLINVKEVTGAKWEPINFGKLFKNKIK